MGDGSGNAGELWECKSFQVPEGGSLTEFHQNNAVGSKELFAIIPKFSLATNAQYFQQERCFCVAGYGEFHGIVLDNSLFLVEKDQDEVYKKFHFCSLIDFVIWRRSILLVGLCSSEIHLIDPGTYQTIKKERLSKTIRSGSKQRFFVDAFIHSSNDVHAVNISLLAVTGLVFSFSNVPLSDGSINATQDDNESVIIDIGNLKVKCYSDCRFEEDTEIVTAVSPSWNTLITGDSSGKVTVFDFGPSEIVNELRLFRSDNVVSTLGLDVGENTIVKIDRAEGLIFLLLSNGSIHILLDEEIFPTDKLNFPYPDTRAHDFVVVMADKDCMQLWVLFGDSKINKHYVGIYTAPDFRCQFYYVIPCPATSFKSRYAFEMPITCFDEPSAFIETVGSATLNVFYMKRSSCDATLQNLINKRRFDEAEELANRYQKDIDDVRKAKVKALFSDIMSNTRSNETSEAMFSAILNTLKKIEDSEFVCDFCLKYQMPKVEWVKQLLTYGGTRSKTCSKSETAKSLLRILMKFYTFEKVFLEGTIEQWASFKDENNSMLSQCLTFLQNRQFAKAEIVWIRHYHEFIHSLELREFSPFFVILFTEKLQSVSAASLFRTIIPFAIDKCVNVDDERCNNNLEIVLALTAKQIRTLERETDWPKDGIMFVKLMLEIVQHQAEKLRKPSMHNVSSSFRNLNKKFELCELMMTKLEEWLESLHQLSELKYQHSIGIPFEEYTQKDVSGAVSAMLYNIFYSAELKKFIVDFLYKYCERKSIDVDLMLYNHIQDVSEDLEYFVSATDIPDEERVISIIDFIKSHMLRVESVLCIVKNWPVPWTSSVTNLVDRTLMMPHPENKEMKGKLQQISIVKQEVPFKIIVKKHKLCKNELFGFQNIYVALQKILRSRNPDSYADCQELIKHTGCLTEEQLMCLRFRMLLLDPTLPIDDAIPSYEMDKENLKVLLRFVMEYISHPLDTFDEDFNDQKERQKRLEYAGKTLAELVGDCSILRFFEYRKYFSNIKDPDAVCQEDFYLTLIQEIMSDCCKEDVEMTIEKLYRVAAIAFKPCSTIFAIAASFFSEPCAFELIKSKTKLWKFLKLVVDMAHGCLETNEVLQNRSMVMACFLTCQVHNFQSQEISLLEEFIKLTIKSFDPSEIFQGLELLQLIRIVKDLRDKEIPFEKEFMEHIGNKIWMTGNAVHVSSIEKPLKKFGEVLMMFGEDQLFNFTMERIIKKIAKIHPSNKTVVSDLLDLKQKIKTEALEGSHSESDPVIADLVERFRSAEFKMNEYALNKRNKPKLLKDLISRNQFLLAADVALVFKVYDEKDIWSDILKGLISSRDHEDLQRILGSLKDVPELWLLPEFSEAWLQASSVDEKLKDMCPIPIFSQI